jgi:transcriptional regulator with XRE-family HTH domain
MPAKKPFSKAQYDVLHRTLVKVKKSFKNQEQLALALHLTQPSLSALLLKKWQPSISTGKAIANLEGVTLEDLVGEYSDGTAPAHTAHDDPFPNLDVCIRFYSGRKAWSPWTTAAARAGFFGPDDVAPPAWAERLDHLEQLLATAKKAG